MKKLAIGIDIGGTNTAFGFVDETGYVFAESTIPTSDYPYVNDYPTYIADLCQAIHALATQIDFEYELAGIGVGAPNANYHLGTIETPANLWKYRDDDLNRDDRRRIFRIADDIAYNYSEHTKVLITNDANAATIGEMVYGNAKGMKDFVMITLGTGLGSGFVANGELICGNDGMAGEYGHAAVVHEHGRMCGCGQEGHLEAYVSSPGIVRTVFELMAKMDNKIPSRLRSISFDDMSSKKIAEAAEAGDPIAVEAFRYTGEILGRALANMATVTSPEAIFLFGGMAKSGRLLFEPTKKYMEEHMLFVYKNKIKLLPSGIQGKNAAILGSSALVWQSENK